MSLRVKICGVTSLPDAVLCKDLGADFIGLIFAESPRRIKIDVARQISRKLAGKIPLVGVFDHYDRDSIVDLIERVKLDYLQVYYHPDNGSVLSPPVPLFSSIWVDEGEIKLPPFPCKYLLLDFKRIGRIEGLDERKWVFMNEKYRVFLAGGIDQDNVQDIVERYRPFGIDVARGTETGPGVKDPDRCAELIRRAKNC
jgi:phosphoribosylanthranilate isomerase